MIGSAGVTDAVLKEIDLALKSHELIKIRMLGDERDRREDALQRIAEALDAVPVQMIGKILVVFRPRPEEPAAPPPPKRERGKKRGERRHRPARRERR
jgi:putative YhbY family RNA-binding protein